MKEIKDFIAPHIAELPPSGIRKFFDIASSMKGVLSLSIGEPDFDTPWRVTRAGISSLERGGTHYTSNWGRIELRRLIARYMEERYGVSYCPDDEILITIGASEGIDLVLRTLIDPSNRDEVIIPDPSYVSYAPNVRAVGGVPVAVRLNAENGFKLTADQLEKAITPKTKVVILPFPNNPTGAVMNRAELEALAAVIKKHDIMVLSDEIYAELTYGEAAHTSFASIEGMYERTLVINGFSKSFAMTGWRVGFLCGNRDVLALCQRIHQYVIMCVPTVSQCAAEEALSASFETDYADIRQMREAYDRRRRLLVTRLNEIGLACHEPMGAFYVFPNVTGASGLNSEEFCTRLLNEKKIAIVPGNAFGPAGEGHARISYAASEETILTALRRMEEFLNGKV